MILRRLPDSRYSEVVPEWLGGTVVLIGAGHSLTLEQIAMVKEAHDAGRLNAIAVNDAYLWAPWADVLYFADWQYWEWHTRGTAKPMLNHHMNVPMAEYLATPALQSMEEPVNSILQKADIASTGVIVIAGVLAVGIGLAMAGTTQVTLSGAEEVPSVQTSASGSGSITVGEDGSVSGSVSTKGVNGTMAHIHEAAPGQNGGVAVPLTKKGDNEWVVPAGAKLTDDQFKAFQAGNLYVNVHSDAHKGGEIRGQLKP